MIASSIIWFLIATISSISGGSVTSFLIWSFNSLVSSKILWMLLWGLIAYANLLIRFGETWQASNFISCNNAGINFTSWRSFSFSDSLSSWYGIKLGWVFFTSSLTLPRIQPFNLFSQLHLKCSTFAIVSISASSRWRANGLYPFLTCLILYPIDNIFVGIWPALSRLEFLISTGRSSKSEEYLSW